MTKINSNSSGDCTKSGLDETGPDSALRSVALEGSGCRLFKAWNVEFSRFGFQS